MPDISKIGLALYTVSQYMQTIEQCRETLQRVRAIGYQNVELGYPLDFPFAPFDTLLAENDLHVIDLHVGLPVFEQQYAEVLRVARHWQCTHLTIPMMTPGTLTTATEWKQLAKTLTVLGKRLADDGITFQYHNHHFEFLRYDGQCALEILYAESDPAYLKPQLDTHWVARGGGEPTAWIQRMAGRIEQVHCKDFRLTDAYEPIFTAVGQGNLNWSGILPACKAAHVQHYIVEEDPNPLTPDPFRSIEHSLAFLRDNGIA